MPEVEKPITQFLEELKRGDQSVMHELLPVVYDELRRLAHSYLNRERANHTLEPTALVHEVYLRLIRQKPIEWENRAHFFGVAAQIMRRILVDHARQHQSDKRGGKFQKFQINENFDKAVEISAELIRLDETLNELAESDAALAKLVELRYFGGLTFEETAEGLGISLITAKRHWKLARAWLYDRMTGEN